MMVTNKAIVDFSSFPGITTLFGVAIIACSVAGAVTIIKNHYWESPTTSPLPLEAEVISVSPTVATTSNSTQTSSVLTVDQSTEISYKTAPTNIDGLSLAELRNEYIVLFKNSVNFISDTVCRRAMELWNTDISENLANHNWLSPLIRPQHQALFNKLKEMCVHFSVKHISEGDNSSLLVNYNLLDIFIKKALECLYYEALREASSELFTVEMAENIAVFYSTYLIGSGI